MSKVGPFILGGLVGAAIGILYAPRTGDQTRALLAEKIGAVWGEAKEFGSNAASDPQGTFQGVVSKGQEFAKTATDSASKALGAVRGRSKDATGQVDPAFSGTTDSDELRAKIEAARQRIAAQVMANAQETSAKAPVEAEAEAKAEEVAEKVEEVADKAAEKVEEAKKAEKAEKAK